MIAIEAEDVSFSIGQKRLVDNVSAQFRQGEMTAIVGPNGAGKSTLTRLLSGELKPTSGDIRIKGQNLFAIKPWRLASMRAVLPQASQLAFPFSAFEVASLGATGIGHGLTRRERRDIALRALEQADMLDLQSRPYEVLSGGEKQRVHFARVLAQLEAGKSTETQQVLFLDEPIASLDLKHQLQLLHKVRRLADDGTAVIAVLHDLQLAADMADTILVLSDGRVNGHGAPLETLTKQSIESVFEIGLSTGRLPPAPWNLT